MVTGFSPVALQQLGEAIGGGGGATTVVIDFSALARAVDGLRAEVARVATALENPTWAAGDEMYRRACSALSHGWYEDAERDARASIDAFPYRAGPHLVSAIALLETGETVQAFAALESAVRYGAAEEPAHAATAALLAAQLADGAGASTRTLKVLSDGDGSTQHQCPAIVGQRLVREPESRELRDRLWLLAWIDPEAAVAAVEANAALFEHQVPELTDRHARLHSAAAELARSAATTFEALMGSTPEFGGHVAKETLRLRYTTWNYGDDHMSYRVPWGWYVDEHVQKDDRGVGPSWHSGLEEFRGIHWDPALARKVREQFQAGRTANLINEVRDRASHSADLHTMLSEGDRLSFTTGQLTGVLETARDALVSVTRAVERAAGAPITTHGVPRLKRKAHIEAQRRTREQEIGELRRLVQLLPDLTEAKAAREAWREMAPQDPPANLVRPFVDFALPQHVSIG